MNKKTITLGQAKKRMQFFEQVEVYKPITIVQKIVGYIMIGTGVLTLPIPTGSILLIIGGCFLLSIDYKKLLNTLNFYSKETSYWFLRAWRNLRC